MKKLFIFIINLKIRILFYIGILIIICLPFFEKDYMTVILNLLLFFIWLPIFLIQIFYKKYKKEKIISSKLLIEFKILSKISGGFLLFCMIFLLINNNSFWNLIIPNHGIGSSSQKPLDISLYLFIISFFLYLFIKINLLIMNKLKNK